jgi:protein-disulfide isomerase
MTDARDRYVTELREKYSDIVEVIWSPGRQNVPTESTDPSVGRSDAPVKLVLFSDFECPFCRDLEPVVAEIMSRFGEDVYWVWKDFPKPAHKNARLAARAARCAQDQGAFWAYKDRLFAAQDQLTRADLVGRARAGGLAQAAFEACLDSDSKDALVDAGVRLGQRYGVSGTPTLFINGRPVRGALPFVVIEKLIREELRAAPGRGL